MPSLIIWGCGGHGRVILDIARAMGCFGQIAFYDNCDVEGQTMGGMRVLSGTISGVRDLGFDACVIAIGANRVRAKCYQEAINAGLAPTSCIHPTAWISGQAKIGVGSVVMPRVVVQTEAEVGVNCILNTGAIVEHDCRLGDHVHLSPGGHPKRLSLCRELRPFGYGVCSDPRDRHWEPCSHWSRCRRAIEHS